METNLFGPLAMASAFVDRIAARSGAIVNVASVLAWMPIGASYGVTKAAMWSATDSMRLELGSRGVQVVASTWDLWTPTWPSFPIIPSPIPPLWFARCSTESSRVDEVLADEMTREVRAQLGKPIHERSRA